jgi:hypothetical protein
VSPSSDSLSATAHKAGQIPFRLRVGVTGHRRLDNREVLAQQIEEVLRRVHRRVASTETTSVRLTVVSPLAEGADRLVARVVMRFDDAALEAVLPLPVSEYRRDFRELGSHEEFEELLREARLVVEAPQTETREQAYERVGRYVVDRCDVLIAIWDGNEAKGQGGTAEMVALANDRRMPIYWIDTRPDHEIREEWCERIAGDAFAEALKYNGARIKGIDAAIAAETQRVMRGPTDLRDPDLDVFASWILPYFVRADRLANRKHIQFIVGTLALGVCATAAVVSAAFLAVFSHALGESARRAPSLLEALLLAAVAVIYWWGTRRNVHPRWISDRFLAERFRSGLYLAVSGLGQRSEGGFDRLDPQDASQDWIRRAFAEVWEFRPRCEWPAKATNELRQFLARSWLGNGDEDNGGGQIGYYLRQSRRCGRLHIRVTRAIKALLGITFVAALAHVWPLGEGPDRTLTWSHVSLFLSLTLPAVGATIAAIAADREYARHAERYRRMAGELTRIRSDLEAAATPLAIQKLTAMTEQVMLEENRGWFGVLRFHGFEPHV